MSVCVCVRECVGESMYERKLKGSSGTSISKSLGFVECIRRRHLISRNYESDVKDRRDIGKPSF